MSATPSVRSKSTPTSAALPRGGAEQVAGHDEAVDLRRALADPLDPHLAVPALERHFLGDAHAAEDLDAAIDDAAGGLRGVDLADRRLHLVVLAEVGLPRGLVDEAARG